MVALLPSAGASAGQLFEAGETVRSPPTSIVPLNVAVAFPNVAIVGFALFALLEQFARFFQDVVVLGHQSFQTWSCGGIAPRV